MKVALSHFAPDAKLSAMKQRDLFLFFALEIFAIALAGVVFSTLPSKIVAGAIAGGYFVISGLYMIIRAEKWPDKWRSPTWYVLFVHVFVISIPLVMSRFLQLSSAFEDVRVLGFAGPVFHNLSSGVFSVLIASTIVDWLRVKWASRKKPTN